jgi:hypothetical protein
MKELLVVMAHLLWEVVKVVGGWVLRALWEVVKALFLFLVVWGFGMMGILTFLFCALAGGLAFSSGAVNFAISATVAAAVLTGLPTLLGWVIRRDGYIGYLFGYLIGGFVGGALASILVAIVGLIVRLLIGLKVAVSALDPVASVTYFVLPVAFGAALWVVLVAALEDWKARRYYQKYLERPVQV